MLDVAVGPFVEGSVFEYGDVDGTAETTSLETTGDKVGIVGEDDGSEEGIVDETADGSVDVVGALDIVGDEDGLGLRVGTRGGAT